MPNPTETDAELLARLKRMLETAAMRKREAMQHLPGDVKVFHSSEASRAERAILPNVPRPLAIIDEKEAEVGALEEQLEEARYEPWPKWAEDMQKTIRAASGYVGYDDATDGVNLPEELDELINHLTSEADRNLAEARASRKLDEAERAVEHYRAGMTEWIARAQAAEAQLVAALTTPEATNDTQG